MERPAAMQKYKKMHKVGIWLFLQGIKGVTAQRRRGATGRRR
jgi:hypothetical protein